MNWWLVVDVAGWLVIAAFLAAVTAAVIHTLTRPDPDSRQEHAMRNRHIRLAAALVAAAALTAPTAAATPTPAPDTATAVTAAQGPDDRRKTRRYWKSLNRSQKYYHCMAYDQHPARYKAGYQFGVRLDGGSARQSRQMWRSWKRILERKC